MDCSPSMFYTVYARWCGPRKAIVCFAEDAEPHAAVWGSEYDTSWAHRTQHSAAEAGRVCVGGVNAIYAGMMPNDSGLDAVDCA